MIFLGKHFLSKEKLYFVSDINSIKSTPPNSTILFKWDKDLSLYAHKNNIDFAIEVNSIKEILYSANLQAKYIIVDKNLSIIAQKLATEYLFDSKIIVKIYNENDIEEIAKNFIDGVILI